MKKLLFTLILLASLDVYAQTISRAEYFIDTDPGVGNATSITITPADPFIVDLIIPTAGLQPGLHSLHIRVMDNSGYWSHYEQRLFYIDATAATKDIIELEYFIDTDPGVGNATPITFSPDSVISFNTLIPTTGLNEGLHTLHLRAKDDAGFWSLYEARLFYVEDHISGNIVALEYFFNSDPGFGNGKLIPITAGNSISIDHAVSDTSLLPGINVMMIRAKDSRGYWSHYESRVLLIDDTLKAADKKIIAAEYWYDTDPGMGNGTPIAISNPSNFWDFADTLHPNLPLGEYTIYVRVKDDQGDWSMYEGRKIKVCSQYGPLADFSLYQDRNKIYLTNNSEHYSNLIWNFGDNTTNTILINPTHVYTPGKYSIELKTINPCGRDSMKTEIEIKGISRISPNVAANDGYFLFEIKGYGLTPNTKITLSGTSGSIVIDSIITRSSTEAKVIAKFNNEPAGVYDVIAEIPGNPADTLFAAVTLEPVRDFDPWIQIHGRNAVAVNRDFPFYITFGNHGNKIALGVPVHIRVSGDRIASLKNVIIEDSLVILPEIFDSLKAFDIAIDSVTGDSVLLGSFLMPIMMPGVSYQLYVPIRSPFLNQYNIDAIIDHPWYDDSGISLRTRSICDISDCAKCMLDILGYLPGVGCFTGVYGFGCSIENAFKDKTKDPNKKLANVASVAGAFGSALFGCFSVVNPGKALALGMKAAGAASSGKSAWDFFQDCDKCIKGDKDNKKPQTFTSVDPNIKIGLHGINNQNYINGKDPNIYTIYFENVDTATAPATEVIIYDTIDTNLLDLNSFEFISYGFGDSLYFVEGNKFEFVEDIDLRPSKDIILRVHGILDTTSGLLTYTFSSFDPATMDLTFNITQGFLPPNLNKPEGEGFVMFKLDLKPGYDHLDVIENKAEIVFDANESIKTPIWINTIDLEKPQSAVLALNAIQNDTTFTVKWVGTDAHAGLMDYIVYISENDSAYYPLVYGYENDSTQFTGKDGATYKFYSIARDHVGNVEDPPVDPLTNPDAVTTIQMPIGIDERPKAEQLWMSQNRPNPFMLDTRVEFYIPKHQQVMLQIFDHSGRLVQTLMEQQLQQGQYNFTYTATELESGIYFLKLSTPDGGITKKMILMR